MNKSGLSPIFFLAIAFVLGIVLADYLRLPLWLSIALILVSLFLLLTSLFRPFRAGRFLPYLLFFGLGFFLTSLVILSLENSLLVELAREGKSAPLNGQVVTEPKRDESKTSFNFKVGEVRSNGRCLKINELLKVIIRNPGKLRVENGARLQIQGRLMQPRSSSGDSFDYQRYLYRQRIQTLMMVQPGQIKILGRSAEPVNPLVNSMRQMIMEGVNDYLPGSKGGLMLGILLGDTSGISKDIQDDFRVAGLTHLLAVSGLNVGALMLICFFIARLSRLKLALSYPLTSIVIVFYALLTQCQPSVLRASLMAIIGLGGFLLGRRRDLVATISATALILLIYDPFLLYNISFQLSFAATYAIIFITQILDNKMDIEPSWLKSLISVALAAQLGVAPILLYYFKQLSLISLLANVMVVPANAPVLALGIGGGIAGLVSGWLAYPAYLAAGVFLSYMIGVADLLANIPGSSLVLEKPSLAAVFCYYIALLAALVLWTKHPRLRLNLGHLVIALLLPLVVLTWGQIGKTVIRDKLKTTFFDVGQGDSILIQTKEGETMLIDGGENPARLKSLLDGEGVQRIDLLVLTHPHFDHVGGLAGVIDDYPVGLVLDSGQPHTSGVYLKFLKSIERTKTPYRLARRGQQFELGKLKIEVLHPAPDLLQGASSDLNNNSVVLKIVHEQLVFLFTGDIGTEGEESIIAASSGGASLKATVLKVPHHGSVNSGSIEFFEAVRPEAAVISAGKGNPYGHPSSRTIKKLKATGAKVYRTDENGSVTITSDGKELAVKVSKENR